MPKTEAYVKQNSPRCFCQSCGDEIDLKNVVYIQRNAIPLKVCKECSEGQELIEEPKVKNNISGPRFSGRNKL